MTLRRGAVLSPDAAIRAAIEMTARDHRPGTFAVCFVDLGDVDGRRFAAALHRASPHGPDPTSLAQQRPSTAWCRCASLATLADVAGEVLGAETCAAVHCVSRAGAVPVVLVLGRGATVQAFPAPGKAP